MAFDELHKANYFYASPSISKFRISACEIAWARHKTDLKMVNKVNNFTSIDIKHYMGIHGVCIRTP
jgi:hypothetical protein